jgi:hypothetical protein
MVISLLPSFPLPAFRPVEKMGEIYPFYRTSGNILASFRAIKNKPAVGDLFRQDFPLSAFFI